MGGVGGGLCLVDGDLWTARRLFKACWRGVEDVEGDEGDEVRGEGQPGYRGWVHLALLTRLKAMDAIRTGFTRHGTWRVSQMVGWEVLTIPFIRLGLVPVHATSGAKDIMKAQPHGRSAGELNGLAGSKVQ